MKKLILFLVFITTTSLYAGPKELAFLETILPNSKHVYTHVVGMHPTGMIMIEYESDEKIETVISALDKTLGVKLTETPDVKDDRLQLFGARLYRNPPIEHKRVQAGGLTIDIETRFSPQTCDGPSLRRIHVYIVRKGP